MTPKAIFFDLDGTLLDSILVVLDAFEKTFFEAKKVFPDREIFKKEIGKDLTAILSPHFSPREIPKIIANYRKNYLQIESRISLFPGVKSALLRFSTIAPLGVVTTKLRTFSEKLLRKFEILDFFEMVVGAEDVSRCKPHPEPLLTAAEKIGVAPKSAVYVGDSLADARAARAAKMPFFGVLTGVASKSELEKFGPVFKNIGEITF